MTDKETKKLEEKIDIKLCLEACKSIDYLNGLEKGINKRKDISYEKRQEYLEKIKSEKINNGYIVK